MSRWEAFWIQMWIDKQTLKWNPWTTDKYEKKRPCHIQGLRKMNEFDIMKKQQDIDKQKQRQGNQQQLSKLGKGGVSYSQEYAKLKYRDPDMRRLAEEGKGTTNSYDYQSK